MHLSEPQCHGTCLKGAPYMFAMHQRVKGGAYMCQVQGQPIYEADRSSCLRQLIGEKESPTAACLFATTPPLPSPTP